MARRTSIGIRRRGCHDSCGGAQLTPSDFVLPESSWPAALPELHRSLLARISRALRANPGIIALAAGGSFISGTLDEFSDLDLVVVVTPTYWPRVLEDRSTLARTFGPLLAAFTGEHVGEPRLLICLYGPPLVHVDLKFLPPDALDTRVEDPIVLWDRTGLVQRGLARAPARYPAPDLQWIEDRFWVWVHYAAAKLARGELFELLNFLGFLRAQVLGPLALQEVGAQSNGVRKLEQYAPRRATELKATLARHDRVEAARALQAAINLYLDLRSEVSASSLVPRPEAQAAALAFFRDVAEGVKGTRS